MSLPDFGQGRKYILDGGMGSMLQRQGLKGGELPEMWNLEHPEVVSGIHGQYYQAGSRMLATNTFGANILKMGKYGDRLDEIVAAAVANVRRGVMEASGGNPEPYFVGIDMGPTGKLLEPLGDLSFDACYEAYARTAVLGEKAGADYATLETFGDLYELKAAILAVKENTRLPVLASVTYDSKGTLLTGGDVACVAALLTGLRVDAIGMNCGVGPAQMLGLVKELRQHTNLPILVKPNAGLPVLRNGVTEYDIDSETWAQYMVEIAEAGGVLLGGCCGTTPEYIRKLREKLEEKFSEVGEEDRFGLGYSRREGVLLSKASGAGIRRTIVSSYCQAVEFGNRPVIIGERINPTGKKKFKEALRNQDIDYILREGINQAERGAHILDVNVGLPEIDEPSMMHRVVTGLQGVTGLPLQIDTVNPEALEKALRYYNGKALVNSVNGKQESMDTVFPLIAKYGGAVIALTLDEAGIPETAEGRADIAGRIIGEAAKYGIGSEDIIVDVLTMAISAQPDGAKVALEAIRLVRERYGVHTSLGVSNISFGLPQRAVVNATFYAQALQTGLSAAIINPLSDDMMKVYYSYCALAGLDENCSSYIDYAEEYGKRMAEASASGAAVSASGAAAKGAGGSAFANAGASRDTASGSPLNKAVFHGLKGEAAAIAGQLLEGKEPLSIINDEIIPALNDIGKGFEDGSIFLPKLMSAAEAAQEACAVIKNYMEASGKERSKSGKIVLATVQDDIHDIGKNIVKILLDNYGFEVIDLGKNVPAETIVEAVVREEAPMLGLSALMTTTVFHMKEVITLLKERGVSCRVAVGGAVLTQEYADQIGADFYGSDAMQTVRYAQKIFG